MNEHDPFEQRLRRQSVRPVPPAWREQILAAARSHRRNATAPSVSEDDAALLAGWRLLFGRFPLAWAALAALWIVLVGVNLTLPGPFVSLPVPGHPSANLEALAALDFQPSDLLSPGSELQSAPKATPIPVQPAAPHRPRSERQREIDTGAIRLPRAFTKADLRFESVGPLTRPTATLSPSDGERDGVRGFSEIGYGSRSFPFDTVV